jgi:hypothetical protein
MNALSSFDKSAMPLQRHAALPTTASVSVINMFILLCNQTHATYRSVKRSLKETCSVQYSSRKTEMQLLYKNRYTLNAYQ